MLNAKGESYQALVRSAYRGRQGEFLFFINQLAEAENQLNKALAPQLKKESDGVSATIKKIEKGSAKLRQEELKEIFSSII